MTACESGSLTRVKSLENTPVVNQTANVSWGLNYSHTKKTFTPAICLVIAVQHFVNGTLRSYLSGMSPNHDVCCLMEILILNLILIPATLNVRTFIKMIQFHAGREIVKCSPPLSRNAQQNRKGS